MLYRHVPLIPVHGHYPAGGDARRQAARTAERRKQQDGCELVRRHGEFPEGVSELTAKKGFGCMQMEVRDINVETVLPQACISVSGRVQGWPSCRHMDCAPIISHAAVFALLPCLCVLRGNRGHKSPRTCLYLCCTRTAVGHFCSRKVGCCVVGAHEDPTTLCLQSFRLPLDPQPAAHCAPAHAFGPHACRAVRCPFPDPHRHSLGHASSSHTFSVYAIRSRIQATSACYQLPRVGSPGGWVSQFDRQAS